MLANAFAAQLASRYTVCNNKHASNIKSLMPSIELDSAANAPSISASGKPSAIGDLAPGVYWYVAAGGVPEICERRTGESFLRFTSGGRQSWLKATCRLFGPIVAPEV